MAPRRVETRETIPVVEERAVVRKHKKLRGGVRARTVVRKDEQVIDEPLLAETIEVERVRLDRWVEAPIAVRQEGDVTVITLHEEVLVVEKRLKATEEVHLTRRQDRLQASRSVTLRREEVILERLDAVSEDPG